MPYLVCEPVRKQRIKDHLTLALQTCKLFLVSNYEVKVQGNLEYPINMPKNEKPRSIPPNWL